MAERTGLKSLGKLAFVPFVAPIVTAAPCLASNGLDCMQFVWLEAKFDFGLLFIIFIAIGGMFFGSRMGRRRKAQGSDKSELTPR